MESPAVWRPTAVLLTSRTARSQPDGSGAGGRSGAGGARRIGGWTATNRHAVSHVVGPALDGNLMTLRHGRLQSRRDGAISAPVSSKWSKYLIFACLSSSVRPTRALDLYGGRTSPDRSGSYPSSSVREHLSSTLTASRRGNPSYGLQSEAIGDGPRGPPVESRCPPGLAGVSPAARRGRSRTGVSPREPFCRTRRRALWKLTGPCRSTPRRWKSPTRSRWSTSRRCGHFGISDNAAGRWAGVAQDST